MRNGSVADVYEWVIQDVVTKVQELFVREGVDPSVLDELRTLWSSKLRKEKVYGVEAEHGPIVGGPYDGSQQDAQARKAAAPPQQPSKSLALATARAPDAPSHPAGTPTLPISINPPPAGTMVLGIPQPGNQYYLQSNVARFGSHTGTPMLPPPHPSYMQVPYMAMPPLNNPAGGEQKPLSESVLGQGSAGLRPQPPVGALYQGAGGPGSGSLSSCASESMSVPSAQKSSIDALSATKVETGGDEGKPSNTKPATCTAALQDGPKDHQPPDSMDRKRKQRDEAGVSNGATNGTHSADSIDHPTKSQRVNGVSGAASRAAERDAGDNKDKEGDEYDEDPPLSDSDDEEVDDPPNFLTAQYEKVSRIKNRWRCQLKYGIFHANGKDYLFKNATGDFTF